MLKKFLSLNKYFCLHNLSTPSRILKFFSGYATVFDVHLKVVVHIHGENFHISILKIKDVAGFLLKLQKTQILTKTGNSRSFLYSKLIKNDKKSAILA